MEFSTSQQVKIHTHWYIVKGPAHRDYYLSVVFFISTYIDFDSGYQVRKTLLITPVKMSCSHSVQPMNQYRLYLPLKDKATGCENTQKRCIYGWAIVLLNTCGAISCHTMATMEQSYVDDLTRKFILHSRKSDYIFIRIRHETNDSQFSII